MSRHVRFNEERRPFFSLQSRLLQASQVSLAWDFSGPQRILYFVHVYYVIM